MFYSQVVSNCCTYWGCSLSEMRKMFIQRSTSLEMRRHMFMQLNPPLILTLTTPCIKVCLSFVPWLDNHQKAISPSLVKQQRIQHSAFSIFFLWPTCCLFVYFPLSLGFISEEFYISMICLACSLTQGPYKNKPKNALLLTNCCIS